MLRTWYKPNKSYKISGNYFNLEKINYKRLLNIPCLGFFSFLTIKRFWQQGTDIKWQKKNIQFKLSRGSQCRFYPVWHVYCFLSYGRGPGWRGPGLFHLGTTKPPFMVLWLFALLRRSSLAQEQLPYKNQMSSFSQMPFHRTSQG